MTRRWRRRVERGERGVALVEFALVFPVFMTLVLGMFSGGLAYSRKVTLTNAAREGSRYGATLAPASLPLSSPLSAGIDEWARVVADAVEQNAEGDLDDGVDGREICVAYLNPAGDADAGVPHKEKSHRLLRPEIGADQELAGDSPGATLATLQCFADGRPNSEKRAQVMVTRRSPINLLFFDIPVTLTAESVTRFEATEF